MKRIPLWKGRGLKRAVVRYALVDDADYHALAQYKWRLSSVSKGQRTIYAQRNLRVNGENTIVLMHRHILGLGPGRHRHVDHRDHNGLNNQRYNIRVCTQAQNVKNARRQLRNTSGYRGVTRTGARWVARIRVNKKLIILGYFQDVHKAGEVYRQAAIKYHGEFANAC